MGIVHEGAVCHRLRIGGSRHRGPPWILRGPHCNVVFTIAYGWVLWNAGNDRVPAERRALRAFGRLLLGSHGQSRRRLDVGGRTSADRVMRSESANSGLEPMPLNAHVYVILTVKTR